jgi:hypothetical protein
MRITKVPQILAALVFAVLCGCKHHNAINFVTNTEFGVKVGVNAEKIPEVKIGYGRQEAARVPVYLMDGAIAKRTRGEVNSLLNQAAINLEKASGASTAATQAPYISSAVKLVNAAAVADTASKKDASESLIIPEIKTSVANLVKNGTTLESKESIDYVRGLIAAERERPVFHTEFQEAGKFIGSRKDKDANDAYSVIGTFKGNAGGNAGSQANAKMGIAQYFATGIAAQLLAEGGGAALVSTAQNAKTPDESEEIKVLVENWNLAQKTKEQAIIDYVAPGGVFNHQKLIDLAGTTLADEAQAIDDLDKLKQAFRDHYYFADELYAKLPK